MLLALGAAARALAQRWTRADEDSRRYASVLLAAAATLFAQASIDWLWAIPGLTGLALLCLGLAVAVLTEPAAPSTRDRWTIGADASLRAAAAVAAIAVAALVASGRLRCATPHHTSAAPRQSRLDAARQAHSFNPWALRPHYLAAGALERLHRPEEARASSSPRSSKSPATSSLSPCSVTSKCGRVGRRLRASGIGALALNPRDAGLQRLAH